MGLSWLGAQFLFTIADFQFLTQYRTDLHVLLQLWQCLIQANRGRIFLLAQPEGRKLWKDSQCHAMIDLCLGAWFFVVFLQDDLFRRVSAMIEVS